MLSICFSFIRIVELDVCSIGVFAVIVMDIASFFSIYLTIEMPGVKYRTSVYRNIGIGIRYIVSNALLSPCPVTHVRFMPVLF